MRTILVHLLAAIEVAEWTVALEARTGEHHLRRMNWSDRCDSVAGPGKTGPGLMAKLHLIRLEMECGPPGTDPLGQSESAI